MSVSDLHIPDFNDIIRIIQTLLAQIIVLVASLWKNTLASNLSLSQTKDFFSILQSGFTILGIVVGGVWAYFKFIKGRLFKPRLALEIEAKFICDQFLTTRYSERIKYLLITIQFKNVGLSKVEIAHDASG